MSGARFLLVETVVVVLLVLATVFLLVQIYNGPAPRPAADIRYGLPGAITTQQRTGAPPQGSGSSPTPSGPTADEGTDSGTARGMSAHGGAPNPSEKLGDWSCSAPPLCGETPQPRIVDGISGEATWWYSFGPGIYTALRPDLGSKGDLVIVCGGEPFHCRTAPVITSCACLGPNSERLVDLSRDLFAEFADPSVGVVRVVIQVIGR